MPITVVKEFSFDAAHYLPDHSGKCQSLHGHHFVLQVGFNGVIDNRGMVMDFKEIKDMVKQSILDKLDHTCLNQVTYKNFPASQPTAENIVIWITNILVSYLPQDVSLTFMRLYETPTSYVEWRFL